MVTPPLITAPSQRRVRDSEFLRPRGEAQGDAAVRDLDVRSGVAGLGCGRRPSTVAGLVVPVVVDSIDGEDCSAVPFPFGTRAHVFQERLKAATPSGANGDATRSVVLVSRAAGGTPFNHGSPDFVLGRPAQTVRGLGSARPFPMKASAALAASGSQIAGSRTSFATTVASTKPHHLTMTVVLKSADNRESAEPLTSQISKSRHQAIIREVGVYGKEWN